ncbi:MAG: hypothetical protein K9J12_01460 [Melioribacteraceae bacterium]|nr:hypothetical protein [Melioribacteraceae bacterium]MCF8265738.1 hypothetical protein [Melioribacteraceae bacterium]MCF8432755.1 hypothetical protein [Melioribacteraceae bacterium]
MKKILLLFNIVTSVVFYSCNEELIESENAQLKIISPNGGETLIVDSTYIIRWESQDVNNINIFYSVDSGMVWEILEENINASNGQFSWKIPNSITKTGLVKISVPDNSIQDASDNNFNITYSLETFKYYSLNIGDIWIYDIFDDKIPVDYIVKREIIEESLINGEKFFLVKEIPIIQDTYSNSPYSRATWQRIDSSSGIIYRQAFPWIDRQAFPWIDLKMKAGEVFEKGSPSDLGSNWYRIEVLSENNTELFGISTTVKKYKKLDLYQSYLYDFAKNIGQIRYRYNGDFRTYDLKLKGAVLNGVAIGDTTTQ